MSEIIGDVAAGLQGHAVDAFRVSVIAWALAFVVLGTYALIAREARGVDTSAVVWRGLRSRDSTTCSGYSGDSDP